MADNTEGGYDTSTGTNDRGAVGFTKLWAVVLGVIFLAGLIMLGLFLTQPFGGRSSGPASSENTASRPAEP